jgi:hypothetical protein
MRFFRDRYFKILPLTAGDWAALSFKAKGPHPAPVSPPSGVPPVSLSYPGGPTCPVRTRPPPAGTGTLDSESDRGCAIYAGVMLVCQLSRIVFIAITA